MASPEILGAPSTLPAYPDATSEAGLSQEVGFLHRQILANFRGITSVIDQENPAISHDPRGFEIRLYPSTIDGNRLNRAILDRTLVDGELAAASSGDSVHGLNRAHALSVFYNHERQTLYFGLGYSVEEELVRKGILPANHRLALELDTPRGLDIAQESTLRMDFKVDSYVRQEGVGFPDIGITSKQKVDGSLEEGSLEVEGAEYISRKAKIDMEFPNDPRSALIRLVGLDLRIVNYFLENADKMHIFALSSTGRFSEIDGAINRVVSEMLNLEPNAPIKPKPYKAPPIPP